MSARFLFRGEANVKAKTPFFFTPKVLKYKLILKSVKE
jgi:hypothetical protein